MIEYWQNNDDKLINIFILQSADKYNQRPTSQIQNLNKSEKYIEKEGEKEVEKDKEFDSSVYFSYLQNHPIVASGGGSNHALECLNLVSLAYDEASSCDLLTRYWFNFYINL